MFYSDGKKLYIIKSIHQPFFVISIRIILYTFLGGVRESTLYIFKHRNFMFKCLKLLTTRHGCFECSSNRSPSKNSPERSLGS